MVTVVIVINVLIALFGFYTAWQVWRLRQALSQATDALIVAERNTHQVLHQAPEAILRKQLSAQELRRTYQQLEPKFRQARQALALISLSQTVLGRRSWFLAMPRRVKKPAPKRKSQWQIDQIWQNGDNP